MGIKQEQLVFVCTAALLGWWVASDLSEGTQRGRGGGGGRAPELDAHPAPDPSLALAARDDLERLPRDLFTPPRDTAPLPPLGLETPPQVALEALWPPPAATLAVSAYSSLLRTPVTAMPSPGLFDGEVAGGEDLGAGALDDIGVGGGAGTPDDEDLLTAEERVERRRV